MAWVKRHSRALVIAAVLLAAAVVCGGWLLSRSQKVGVYWVSDLNMGYYDDQYFEGEVVEGGAERIARSEGDVESIRVKVGDAVQKGDVLLVYDVQSHRLSLASAAANIALMKSQIAQTQSDLDALQKKLKKGDFARAAWDGSPTVATRPLFRTEEDRAGRDPEIGKDSGAAAGSFQLLGFVPARESGRAPEALAAGLASVGEKPLFVRLGGAASTASDSDAAPVSSVDIDTPVRGHSTEGLPQYAVSFSTTVKSAFLQYLRQEEKAAEFLLYQDGRFAGRWIVDGEFLAATYSDDWTPADWTLGDGVQREKDGRVTVDFGKVHYGVFSTERAEASDPSGTPGGKEDPDENNGSADPSGGDPDDPGSLSDDPDDPGDLDDGEDDWPVYDDAGDDSYDDADGALDDRLTKQELTDLIKEKQAEITSLQRQLRTAEIQYRKDELAADTGEVRASAAGVVSYVGDPASIGTGNTLIQIRQEANCTVRLYADEFQRDSLQPGDKLTVKSYNAEESFTATVEDVGTEPESASYRGDSGISYYPVNCTVSGGAQGSAPEDVLTVGSYCELRPKADGQGEEEPICIEAAYVRKDAGGAYVMAANEWDRLEKRYVEAEWPDSYMAVIRSGLTEEDRLAFPYGKAVKEGAVVQEGDDPW